MKKFIYLTILIIALIWSAMAIGNGMKDLLESRNSALDATIEHALDVKIGESRNEYQKVFIFLPRKTGPHEYRAR